MNNRTLEEVFSALKSRNKACMPYGIEISFSYNNSIIWNKFGVYNSLEFLALYDEANPRMVATAQRIAEHEKEVRAWMRKLVKLLQ